jgi:YfiH family protein
MSAVAWIEPEWAAPPGVRALCTKRGGGASAAPFDSLNLGAHVGDAAGAVLENRARLRKAARMPAEPRWLSQVHGIEVADLDSTEGIPVADAAVSAHAGTVCAVLTADCLPVLLSAVDGSVVGAVHAGWRGLAAGVIETALQALRARSAPGIGIQAWMGPAIGPGHFEVGAEVRTAFLQQDPAAAEAFAPNDAGRWQCDLYALARLRLQSQGVGAITGGGLCTYDAAADFYSHRRDVQHLGRAGTGRMASLIWRD